MAATKTNFQKTERKMIQYRAYSNVSAPKCLQYILSLLPI